jgi:hypothetical protein
MIEAAPRMMVPEGFVVAMLGSLSLAPYGAPFRIATAATEWLIICRWGLDGEYLSIARAEAADTTTTAAPAGLRPRATFLGLRLADNGAEGSSFLLVRHLPPGLTVAGVFHPTDGIARLTGPATALRLEASGRYAHLRGERQVEALREEVRADVPDPPEGAPEATAWSLSGRRLPWIGEFLAAGAPPDRLVLAALTGLPETG